MRRFCLCIIALLLCLPLSCRRSVEKENAGSDVIQPVVQPLAAPMAVLQAGEFPLWFQFTADGPVLLEAIEDAGFSAALVPWPLALHVRFILAQGEDILMAVNRDGFLRFSLWTDSASIGLYRFAGGEFWRQYTVGAFALLGETPAALLYHDDRFIDSNTPPPSPRLLTFDLNSGGINSVSLPALDAFAPEDGWDIDSLRCGADGYWYFRAVKKRTAQPELRMLRSIDLAQEGETVSLGAFQNTALPESLSAAPDALREMLGAVFSASGGGIAAVVSPEFQTIRSFAIDRDKPAICGHYSASIPFFLAANLEGSTWYAQGDAVRQFSLPPLPEDFVYTGIALCKNTIIASWEEVHEYSIGAAGFMVIQLAAKR